MSGLCPILREPETFLLGLWVGIVPAESAVVAGCLMTVQRSGGPRVVCNRQRGGAPVRCARVLASKAAETSEQSAGNVLDGVGDGASHQPASPRTKTMNDGHSMLGFKPEVFSARTGMSHGEFRRAVLDHILYTRAKTFSDATAMDVYHALAQAVRDRLIQRWLATQATYRRNSVRRVCYLSSEFLTGRSLGLCLVNLGLYDVAREIMEDHGLELGEVLESEGDPGLGNGGLGRLAACIMDSLATLELPAVGYGIRYEFGIFEQLVRDGYQVERRDNWLVSGYPWEVARHELVQRVGFGGYTEHQHDERGRLRVIWVPEQEVIGLPHDSFIVGHHTNNVNTLRLWSARPTLELNLEAFNAGDYLNAVAEQAAAESISKVLYPNDSNESGKQLRLKQQYFFVACSLADILRRHRVENASIDSLPTRVAIQLNDTHPAVAVAELMRLLMDVEGYGWDEAWETTQRCLSYTNHTLLPEALETWAAHMFQTLLPRHFEIICEINRRFMREVHVRWQGDSARLERMTIVSDGHAPRVRMANLAAAACSRINGVAELHTELLKTDVLSDFYDLAPDKFVNQTNGVSPRRWLLHANPALSDVISKRIGVAWTKRSFARVRELAHLADDPELREEVMVAKSRNKQGLAIQLEKYCGLLVDPDSMFIVQAKRFHEYKRQLLALLEVIAEYLALREHPERKQVSKTYFFAGKAASGYHAAKMHIKLINDVASIVNADPVVAGRLSVVFVPNYGVTWAERLIPAADLSVQISLAGREASGTGNMKFAMNGALTIGTLDGANIEIRDSVGADNFFLFGLTVEQVSEIQAKGYRPASAIETSPVLQQVLGAIESGLFCPEEPGRFADVVASLRYHDPYMVCADFDDYRVAQRAAADAYANRGAWAERCIKNIAGASRFTSDETVAGYARDIWCLRPVPVASDVELDIPTDAPPSEKRVNAAHS